jgi:DNA replication and repair protein RecF
LDRAVFNSRASYLADVQVYEKVLKQRNAHLRDPRLSPLLLEVYDEQIADVGAHIVQRRLQYLEFYRPFFEETFTAIYTGDGGDIEPLDGEISYSSQWLKGVSLSGEDDTVDALRACLGEALRLSGKEDRRRGFTTVGPHRDDLETRLGGHDVKAFASQGQTRALVLAMKIAEIRLLAERFGLAPVLLLDDVSSELDRHRNRFLFDFLHGHQGQVFITTTHRDHILLDQHMTVFDVLGGKVSCA